jgi:hypothetical protein
VPAPPADVLEANANGILLFNKWDLSLAELLGGIATGGVGEEDGVADLDVVGERDVLSSSASSTGQSPRLSISARG